MHERFGYIISWQPTHRFQQWNMWCFTVMRSWWVSHHLLFCFASHFICMCGGRCIIKNANWLLQHKRYVCYFSISIHYLLILIAFEKGKMSTAINNLIGNNERFNFGNGENGDFLTPWHSSDKDGKNHTVLLNGMGKNETTNKHIQRKREREREKETGRWMRILKWVERARRPFAC